MARVRLNKLDSKAYEQAFRATFDQVKEDHPEFMVGQTLKGIVLDWSDTQQKGLEKAVGKDIANSVVKGCQVCTKVLHMYRGV